MSFWGQNVRPEWQWVRNLYQAEILFIGTFSYSLGIRTSNSSVELDYNGKLFYK